MVGDDTIYWFTYNGGETPQPFVVVDRPWGEAAVPLPYEVEGGEYRITTRATELVTTVPTDEATARAHDLGEVMWWIDEGTHLIPLTFAAGTVPN